MIYRTSLPHTPIRRTRRVHPVAVIPQFVFKRTPKAFTAATPLPALATVRRNGEVLLAAIDKARDFNGDTFTFVRVRFADSEPTWVTADNIVEVV